MRYALAALLLAACAANPTVMPDAAPCGGVCGAGTACVSGACVVVDAGALDVPALDSGPDVADAFVATDPAPIVDLGSDTPTDVQPEAAADVGVDAGTPDVGADAGSPDVGFDVGTDAGFDAGAVDVPCVAPRVACASGCRSVAGDPSNCGACGNVCATPFGAVAACAAGACGISCLRGYVDCDGDRANGCEAVPERDTQNCGACGARCADGQSCLGGVCRGCPAPMASCGGRCVSLDAICSGRCPDLSSDVLNCGRCGVVCQSGPNGTALCSAGVCRLVCAVPFADCDGVASNGCEVNLSMRANCNACGAACPGSLQCNNVGTGAAPAFRCGCGGGPRIMACDNRCADTYTDPSNCGGCGNNCGERAFCNGASACVACGNNMAGEPLTQCSNACVDLMNSRENCGACGNICSDLRFCANGICRS